MALEPNKQPDLFVIRGDSLSINFSLSSVDLTDATVFFTAKADFDTDATDANAAITKEVTEHTDPTNGTTVIELSSSDTDVDGGLYWYDIQVKKANGQVVSIPAKRMRVWPDVTRRTS